MTDLKKTTLEMMASSQEGSAPGTPQSAADSTYGTPVDESSTMKSNEKDAKDAQLVVGAGRSLKNMLVDLMGVLENQANTKIFIEGDIKLRVDGRESFTIKLRNEDGDEPSNLKVHIDNAPSAANGSTTSKRKSDDLDEVDDAPESPSKRARTEDAPPPAPIADDDGSGDADQSEFDRIMTKFGNVSAQIRWVEECRRLAGQAHDAREEKWRSTSATFHDDNRKQVERHQMWMTAEMGWQRNMLIQLANDLKGLYPLAHSMKWETPPSMNHMAPPIPMPVAKNTPLSKNSPLSNDRPLGKQYVPKIKKTPTLTASAGAKP